MNSIKLRSWALTLLIVLLTATIGWTIVAYATGNATSNEDLLEELEAQRRDIRIQTCILSLPIDQRDAEQCHIEEAAP